MRISISHPKPGVEGIRSGNPTNIFFFFFAPSADGEKYSVSSPYLDVFSYTSCVDLTQVRSQSSCFSGVSFGSRDSDSASCPYGRVPVITRPSCLCAIIVLKQLLRSILVNFSC